jgi:membrane fusion protein (multidrug efflux system)
MFHHPKTLFCLATGGKIIFLSLLITGCSKPAQPPRDGPVQAVMAKVIRQPVIEALSLVGNLKAQKTADLVSELDAHVTEILFSEGQRVTNGQALVVLDNSRPAAQLAAATTEATLRTADLDRGNALLANNTISQQEFDRLQASAQSAQANLLLAQVNASDAIIRAPFDGFVANHDISVGSYIHRGQVISSVVATDTLEANFNVPERYASELKPEQTIALSASSSTNLYEGVVYFISPLVDETTRTILVKARVSNTGGELKPGMFGRLDLALRTRDNALVIPEASIKYGNNAAMVLVGAPNSSNDVIVAEFRPIEIGTRMKDQVEVLSGLTEGEMVVVEGHQKMGPGSKIKISPKSEKYGVTIPAEATPVTPKAE